MNQSTMEMSFLERFLELQMILNQCENLLRGTLEQEIMFGTIDSGSSTQLDVHTCTIDVPSDLLYSRSCGGALDCVGVVRSSCHLGSYVNALINPNTRY